MKKNEVYDKLIPAHVHFARWFVRIRWIAIFILVISNYIVKYLYKISIQDKPIYYLAVILLLLNIFHAIILKRIIITGGSKATAKIKQEIHFQIITDLIILTLILHFSGGIENPLLLFFFFHLIIASSIYKTLQSYLYAAYALLLVGFMAFFECYSVIPHYHIEGFINPDLHDNTFFIYIAGFIYACTAILVVSLSHMIISRSIKSEETFIKSNFELENKDRLKNEYVLRVTHDIKGHLAAILSCLQVIRSGIAGPLNDVQEEFANRAFERTELLNGFVKNLLNLTRKRLQKDSEFEEFLLKDLINKVVIPIQTLARDKSIDFNIYFDSTIQKITGNPFAIEELYSNILLNAVKYTPLNGHVELTVRDKHNQILTEISDSGIGIPKEDLSFVFDEFYRASNVPKDIKTGSGFGLSIVKQIVENHNGKIWITSEQGVWTKVTFLLPKNPTIIDQTFSSNRY
ncbi:MAG: HAMP domain-containing histidine kinase [Bacteroidales bacterium]|nr:HAMP domain-containing histidine kinase [Bacteroidales bacterium]